MVIRGAFSSGKAETLLLLGRVKRDGVADQALEVELGWLRAVEDSVLDARREKCELGADTHKGIGMAIALGNVSDGTPVADFFHPAMGLDECANKNRIQVGLDLTGDQSDLDASAPGLEGGGNAENRFGEGLGWHIECPGKCGPIKSDGDRAWCYGACRDEFIQRAIAGFTNPVRELAAFSFAWTCSQRSDPMMATCSPGQVLSLWRINPI